MPIGNGSIVSPVTSVPASFQGRISAPATDEKSIRILRQGVYQAALNSPGIAGLPYKNEDEYVKLVSSVAEKIIKLTEG